MATDAPYPELKKTHTMARRGPAVARLQAAAVGPGVGGDPGRRLVLDARRRDRARRVRRDRAARSHHDRSARRGARRVARAPAAPVRRDGVVRVPRPGRRGVRAHRDRRALPVHQRSRLHGRAGARGTRTDRQLGAAGRHHPQRCRRLADRGRPGRVLRTARAGDVPDAAARRRTAGAAARVAAPRRAARARPRCGPGAVGDRRARVVARLDRRRQRPARGDRPRGADGARARPRRPGRVPAGRFPRDRSRARFVRRRRARPRVPHRG
jgi:hypothetical protein